MEQTQIKTAGMNMKLMLDKKTVAKLNENQMNASKGANFFGVISDYINDPGCTGRPPTAVDTSLTV